MPLIDYPTFDELDEQTRGMLEGTRTERGDIPAFTRMLANNPTVFEAALGQYGEVLFGGQVDLQLKQLAITVVSQENQCVYCAATHGDALVTACGFPEDQLAAIGNREYHELTDCQRAVAELASQAAVDPKGITADYIADLRDVGFDEADIIELVTVVAQATFANTIADALGLQPTDENPVLTQFYPPQPADDYGDHSDRRT